jgi:two-component system response regulator FixJ
MDPTAPKELESMVRGRGVDLQSFDSIEEFFEYGEADCAACLVLDLRSPIASASGPAETIRAEQISIPVICLTGSREAPLGPVQLAGPGDPEGDSGLIASVMRVLGSANVALRTRSARGEIANRLRSLTPREHQVMERVVLGSSNKLIAYELGISARTIEIHRARVMEKTGAEGLSDLVRMAFAVGAVGVPECSEQQQREA